MVQESSITLFEKVRRFGNTIYHQLNTLTAGFIFYILIKYTTQESNYLHFLLTTLAYIPLMAEGIMMFSEANVWSLHFNRKDKYFIHGPLMLTSTIAAIVGMVIIIQSKSNYNSPHFTSYHGIFGLVSWLLAMLSVIIGLLTFYSKKLKAIVRPVVLKCIHNFFGLSAFVLGIVSLIYGIGTRPFKQNTTENERLVTVWLLISITVWTSVMALFSVINQLKDIF